jgi:hypothetical protein
VADTGPPALHERHAVQRFDRAKEDGGTFAFGLGRHIDHVGGTVHEPYIRMARRTKKRAVVRAEPAISVTRRIADRICLGFDEAPAHAAFGRIVDETFADHEPRELDRIHG